ncbi:MAG: hypothetical protein ACTSRG_23980 [Candidatus Helarchaeota archaeon]
MSLLLLMPFVINYFIFNYSTDINNINYAKMMKNNIDNKNLTLLFPNSGDLEDSLYKYKLTKDLLDLNLTEFHNNVAFNYKYDSDYDCKYWSYVWLIYAYHNKERYDWDVQITEVRNHMFILVSNNESYCILDQNIVNCH